MCMCICIYCVQTVIIHTSPVQVPVCLCMPMNWPCSYIRVCAGACVRNLPSSEFKAQLKTFPLDRPLHKPRLPMPVTVD